MSLTPSTLTIPQGGSGSCTVTTVNSSGVPQYLTLSVSSQLPGGVSAVFAPPTVNVGSNSILTLLVGNTTPGTYSLTIQATGPLTNHTVVLTLIVTASDFTI